MATIPEETDEYEYPNTKPVKTLAQRVKEAERKRDLALMVTESEGGEKPAKWPMKWAGIFKKADKKINRDKALVFYFNKKNEIEEPKFMPIYDGNMIVWKHKVYRFDPRAMWLMKFGNKPTRVYCIREIDRRPIMNPDTKQVIFYRGGAISNQDADEVISSGNSTDSDELLIKAFLKAQTKEVKKMDVNWWIIGIIAAVVLIGGYFFITKVNF
jgi:hypothetical protein